MFLPSQNAEPQTGRGQVWKFLEDPMEPTFISRQKVIPGVVSCRRDNSQIDRD
jgi:hypothetical protein